MGLCDPIEMPKRVRPIIFVIDTSKNMDCDTISVINQTANTSIEKLKKGDYFFDFEIKITVLSSWEANTFIEHEFLPLENYVWNDLSLNVLQVGNLDPFFVKLNNMWTEKTIDDLTGRNDALTVLYPFIIVITSKKSVSNGTLGLTGLLSDKHSGYIVIITDDNETHIDVHIVENIFTVSSRRGLKNILKLSILDFNRILLRPKSEGEKFYGSNIPLRSKLIEYFMDKIDSFMPNVYKDTLIRCINDISPEKIYKCFFDYTLDDIIAQYCLDNHEIESFDFIRWLYPDANI
jgi:hypothetical protein